MTSLDLVEMSEWKQQASNHLEQGNYVQAAQLYERAIEIEPNARPYYWHLGLLLLPALAGRRSPNNLAVCNVRN